jgi:hypothetical protein
MCGMGATRGATQRGYDEVSGYHHIHSSNRHTREIMFTKYTTDEERVFRLLPYEHIN